MCKLSVYVDFDKTIAPKFGFSDPPKEDVVVALRRLAEKYKIVIYSTRGNPDTTSEASQLELLEYLARYQIPHDEVSTCKPLFVAIIDDRSFNPFKQSWESIVDEILLIP